MARMHSGRKGKSGSKKPGKRTKLTWLRYSPSEIELLIVKLAKSGKNQAQIGLILRDVYGVPDVKPIINKRIGQVLDEHKLKTELPLDLINLIKREMIIVKHLEQNKKDQPSRRGLLLTKSKINRLAKYYKKNKQLPQDWKYDREKAKLLIS